MAVVYNSDAGFVYVFKVIDQKAEVCGYFIWADFKSNSVHSTTCGYMLNVDRECLRKPINIMKKLSVSTLQKNRFKTFEEKASYSTGILSNARTNKCLVGQLPARLSYQKNGGGTFYIG